MPRNRIGTLEHTICVLPQPPDPDRERVAKRKISEANLIHEINKNAAQVFFEQALRALPDPRRPQGLRYPLLTVVVTALMAMISGCDDAEAMEDWGCENEYWLKNLLEMPHGVPTQDVYLYVFGLLDPEEFGKVLSAWATMMATHLRGRRHIAVDGKTSRRSFDTGKDRVAIHTVSAWCREAGIVLGQVKTQEKSNEITAIPELLKKLDLKNTTVTIDAMGCQTDIASLIIERGGHYLLAVKENQPRLYHDIETAFSYADTCKNCLASENGNQLTPPKTMTYLDLSKSHGRLEQRIVEVSHSINDWLPEQRGRWPELTFMARVTRERTILSSGKTSLEISYYIGSDSTATVDKIADSIRGHWSIENSLHWVLDIAFREDEARHRAGNTAANLTILRHFSLNLIKRDKTRRLGVANTRKKMGWNPNHLIKLMTDTEVLN